jgi:tRNA-(ms[2]io[6]A)-hydroxylase
MHYYERNIVEIRNEYNNFFINMVAPLVFEGMKSIYSRALDLEQQYDEVSKKNISIKNPGVLKIFQHFLKGIPNLNINLIESEMIRIRDASKNADIFEKIIRALFKSNIILLTYNARLKEETREKVINLNLNNLEVHSYHSFCVKYYNHKSFTDKQIINIILKNSNPLQLFQYDLIILDMSDTLSEHTRNILGLKLPTDPRWVNLAEMQLEEILTDHAYCEQKAATTCISLIQKNPEKELLVEELSPIVTEEWGHFRMVLAELKKRNLLLGRQRKDVYVNKLLDFQKKGGSPTERFLDQMLIMALIEARSCERFKRLSEGMDDEYMRKFYRKFMESEAGHYTLFITLAEHYVDKKIVRTRWAEWLKYEKELMNSAEVRGDRIH